MNVQILHCSPPCTCTYAFSLHPLLPVRVYGYYLLIKMCQICFVNSYQSNNHRQRYKIKKLVQSYQKIQIKTPRRAFDRVCIFLNYTGEMGMDNFGCLNSSLSLFLFCNKPVKKKLWCTYAHSWTSPSPIQASTLLARPPLPPSSVHTLLMIPSVACN